MEKGLGSIYFLLLNGLNGWQTLYPFLSLLVYLATNLT